MVGKTDATLRDGRFPIRVFRTFRVIVIDFRRRWRTTFMMTIERVSHFFALINSNGTHRHRVSIFNLRYQGSPARVRQLRFMVRLRLFDSNDPRVGIGTRVFVTLFGFGQGRNNVHHSGWFFVHNVEEGHGDRNRYDR